MTSAPSCSTRLDGEWYYTHMYHDGEGAKLLEDAKAKREELEGKGWTPADTGAP